MNIARLALKQVAARPLMSGLNVLLLALGLASIALLMLFDAQLEDRLVSNARGIDLVVGAKGSPLQLILSTVYHADIPTGNIPKREADRLARHPLVARAIPLALGDNLQGFRIVGTSRDYPALYDARLAAGRWWDVSMEAVLGARAAARTGLAPGQEFASQHGLAAGGHVHDDNTYQVVGVLAPTGTILDELVLTTPQSVWDLHEGHDRSSNPAFAPQNSLAAPGAASSEPDDDEDDGKPREYTALLLQYKTPLAVLALPRQINAQTTLQAASPAMESARLLHVVGIGLDAFRAFAAILIVSAGLSVFVALYTALQARRFDLAVMRMLGASRLRLFASVLLEGLLLAAGAVLLALTLAHGAAELAGRLELAPGLALSGRVWLWQETWLALLALAVGLFAALLPAVQAYRTEIASVLAER